MEFTVYIPVRSSGGAFVFPFPCAPEKMKKRGAREDTSERPRFGRQTRSLIALAFFLALPPSSIHVPGPSPPFDQRRDKSFTKETTSPPSFSSLSSFDDG